MSSSFPAELYDPSLHTASDELYEAYAALRQDHPVYYSERHNVWCLTRYADVQAAGRDWETFSNASGIALTPSHSYGAGNFLELDPPHHDVLRNVVRPRFVPKAIAELRSDIERHTSEIIADLQEKETADLSQEFAVRLPIRVICRLLGVPEADDELVRRMLYRLEQKVVGQAEVPETATEALGELQDYLSDLAEEKRRNPDDKVMSHIVARQIADGVPAADEVVGLATILFEAGSDTTASLLENLLVQLSENSETLERLRRDPTPELTDAVIEESLRYESPVQWLARTLKAPRRLHGVEVPEGARILLIWGAANRDPERWDHPDSFDVDRKPQRHVAFGEGIHFCLGAPLARLETRIALPAFVSAFSEYEIASKERRPHHILRGWEHLDSVLVPS